MEDEKIMVVQHEHRCLNCYWCDNVDIRFKSENLIDKCPICGCETCGKTLSFIEKNVTSL